MSQPIRWRSDPGFAVNAPPLVPLVLAVLSDSDAAWYSSLISTAPSEGFVKDPIFWLADPTFVPPTDLVNSALEGGPTLFTVGSGFSVYNPSTSSTEGVISGMSVAAAPEKFAGYGLLVREPSRSKRMRQFWVSVINAMAGRTLTLQMMVVPPGDSRYASLVSAFNGAAAYESSRKSW